VLLYTNGSMAVPGDRQKTAKSGRSIGPFAVKVGLNICYQSNSPIEELKATIGVGGNESFNDIRQ